MKLFLEKKFIIFFSCSFLFLLSYNYNAYADYYVSGYETSPLLPKSMKRSGYFIYKYVPERRISIHFNVKNNTNKIIVVKNSLNDAYSDSNGYISYNLNKPKNLLKKNTPKISSMVLGSRSINMKLNPNSSKNGVFHLKMPSNLYKFKGSLLGGINSVSSYHFGSNSSNINNKIQYSTSILLNFSNSTTDLSKITFDSANDFNNVSTLKISNRQYNTLNKSKINIKFFHKNNLVSSITNKRYSLAPNSSGFYKLDSSHLKSGRYLVRVKISKNNNNKIIDKYITIKKNEKTNVFVEYHKILPIWIIIISFVIIIAFILFLSIII